MVHGRRNGLVPAMAKTGPQRQQKNKGMLGTARIARCY